MPGTRRSAPGREARREALPLDPRPSHIGGRRQVQMRLTTQTASAQRLPMSEWLFDESGSDLVEYALLAATVGIMAAAALALMPGILSAVYQSWDSSTQTI